MQARFTNLFSRLIAISIAVRVPAYAQQPQFSFFARHDILTANSGAPLASSRAAQSRLPRQCRTRSHHRGQVVPAGGRSMAYVRIRPRAK